jgi:hypothetical protein
MRLSCPSSSSPASTSNPANAGFFDGGGASLSSSLSAGCAGPFVSATDSPAVALTCQMTISNHAYRPLRLQHTKNLHHPLSFPSFPCLLAALWELRWSKKLSGKEAGELLGLHEGLTRLGRGSEAEDNRCIHIVTESIHSQPKLTTNGILIFLESCDHVRMLIYIIKECQ